MTDIDVQVEVQETEVQETAPSILDSMNLVPAQSLVPETLWVKFRKTGMVSISEDLANKFGSNNKYVRVLFDIKAGICVIQKIAHNNVNAIKLDQPDNSDYHNIAGIGDAIRQLPIEFGNQDAISFGEIEILEDEDGKFAIKFDFNNGQRNAMLDIL